MENEGETKKIFLRGNGNEHNERSRRSFGLTGLSLLSLLPGLIRRRRRVTSYDFTYIMVKGERRRKKVLRSNA